MNQLTKAAKAVATRYNQTSLILRITVGLPAENERFLTALEVALGR